MNLAEHKFLTGYGAALLIAAGALGFLLVKEKGRYQTALDAYNEKATAYNNLRSKPLALTKENLVKLQGQTQVVTDIAVALQEKLASATLPLEEIAPSQFQEVLRNTVSSFVHKAESAGMSLPANFYLGFDTYRNEPPRTEAAAPLLRQLKAIELACNILLDSRISGITGLNRTRLPAESGIASATPEPPAPKKGAAHKKGAAADQKPSVPLVTKYPFQIDFTGYQSEVRKALNALAANDKQFLIIRPLLIQNENTKPIPRTLVTEPVQPEAPAEATPEPAVAAGTPSVEPPLPEGGDPQNPPRQLEYIVGTEKINVQLLLEMTLFEGAFPSSPQK